MEPRDVDEEAEKRLKRAENRQRDVMAAAPEAPAQAREEAARHEGKDDEAGDVVSVCHTAAADCLRRKKMPEQASAKEYHAKPDQAAASRVCASHVSPRSSEGTAAPLATSQATIDSSPILASGSVTMETTCT